MRGHTRKLPSGRWQALYDLGPDPKTGNRRQRTKTFARIEDAEDWLAARIDQVRNKNNRADAGTVTVGGYLELWQQGLAIEDIRESTRAFYRRRVKNHIEPALGATRLRDLSLEQIRAFYATLTPTVEEKVHATLRRALNDAVDDGLLASNPAARAKRGRGKRARGRRRPEMAYWPADELATFLDAIETDRLAALWHLYAMTGVRRGEGLGLQWPDVDLDCGTITVRRSIVPESDEPDGVEDPKREHQRRTLDLDDDTVRLLRAWRKRQIEERLKAGARWREGVWVFTNRDGTPLQPRRTSARFAKLIDGLEVRRIRLHDVRHTHATLMLLAGVQPHVVSKRLGHGGVAITLDVYSHVMPSQQREAVALVARLVARDRGKTAVDA